MPTESPNLARNLDRVRAAIGNACARAGREPSSVTLVAVTKTVGAAEVLELARLGVPDFGENRADALVVKRAEAERLGVRARWHMIGHLQTNKLRRALPAIDVLHSLDRPSLEEALAAETARAGVTGLPVFVQVNVSGESSKGGYDPARALEALGRLRDVPGVRVAGLMTMAPASRAAESSRAVFRRLRELRDEAASLGYLSGLALSMGMSMDYPVAVEEGATLVRVGTALFAG